MRSRDDLMTKDGSAAILRQGWWQSMASLVGTLRILG